MIMKIFVVFFEVWILLFVKSVRVMLMIEMVVRVVWKMMLG